MYIPRLISSKIEEAQSYYPVTVITGPRQSGKTSLCKHLFPTYTSVNLESLTMRNYASTDPEGFLASLGDRVVIDEVQNVPQLLSEIQVAVDKDRTRRYILTGSSNLLLTKTVTQSLSGRASIFTLLPFSFPELNKKKLEETSTNALIYEGLYPGVIADHIPPNIFYANYVTTYIEKDVRDLLKVTNLIKFDNFLRMTALRSGSEFNATSISKEVGVSATTISGWLSILNASYIIFQVQPYYKNINKRLTKMPKIYFYDTGLLAYLLGLENSEQIEKSPFKGMLFENLAMTELIKQAINRGMKPNIFFYREHSGKEVDALEERGGQLSFYEIKSSGTFHADFFKNMEYLKGILGDVTSETLIYDGETFPPKLLNIRDV
ncbi:MAG: ATP-binding protein [Muribaculaceae bacterium]|nr:ATP-binding protein [Muribaculaceae bacterium]